MVVGTVGGTGSRVVSCEGEAQTLGASSWRSHHRISGRIARSSRAGVFRV
ncbi:MAG: hypothetical protein ACK583_07070 [Cyanobacteriota bacterium]